MLRFLLTAAPYLLRAPGQNATKQVAQSFTAVVLFAFSGFALAAAAFVFVTSLYGAAAGFVAVSALFLLAGLIIAYRTRRDKAVTKEVMPEASTDPIASLMPDAIMEDPAVSRVVSKISANPIATSVAAAAIGMLLSRELFKD